MSESKQSDKRSMRDWLPRVTIVMVVLVALLGAGAFAQMRDIERGLLSVTADQQDQYVSLVVRQINLKDNRNDRQMVEQILGSIDGSSSQYWTFTRDGTVLFVKDVNETNKYKGLPTSQFFSEGAAADFYNSLSTDQVQHAYVNVEGQDYIASGQAFDYRDSTYRLVLLTNESVVLDNNQILGARSRLGALLGIEAALLLFTGVWLARQRDRVNRQRQTAQDETARLTQVTEKLNAYIARERTYDAAHQLWNVSELGRFEQSLAKRHQRAWLATVTLSGAARAAFVDRLGVMLGQDVVRFADGDDRVLVLFLRASEQEARESLAGVMGSLAATVSWRQVGAGEDDEGVAASDATATDGNASPDQLSDGSAPVSPTSSGESPAQSTQPAATTSTAPAAEPVRRPHGTARIRDNETKRKWDRQRARRAGKKTDTHAGAAGTDNATSLDNEGADASAMTQEGTR